MDEQPFRAAGHIYKQIILAEYTAKKSVQEMMMKFEQMMNESVIYADTIHVC